MYKKPKPTYLAAAGALALVGCSAFQGARDYATEPVAVPGQTESRPGQTESRPRLEAVAEAAKPFMDEKTASIVGLAVPLLGLLLAAGGTQKPKEKA